MTSSADAFEFSADPARIDAHWVHHVLSTQTYWAAGRNRATQDRAVAASRNYGMYERETGRQVGYARVVTDAVTFAWLADVFIDPGCRNLGLGRALIAGLLEDLAPLGLRRVVLKASDEGRRLYETAGWQPLAAADEWMERCG